MFSLVAGFLLTESSEIELSLIWTGSVQSEVVKPVASYRGPGDYLFFVFFFFFFCVNSLKFTNLNEKMAKPLLVGLIMRQIDQQYKSSVLL